jgi:hypothetical protein
MKLRIAIAEFEFDADSQREHMRSAIETAIRMLTGLPSQDAAVPERAKAKRKRRAEQAPPAGMKPPRPPPMRDEPGAD